MHNRCSFLNLLWAFFNNRCFLWQYLYDDVIPYIAFLFSDLSLRLKLITLLFLKLIYNMIIEVRYFFIINWAWSPPSREPLSSPSDMEWPVNVPTIPKKFNIYPFIVCVLCEYLLSLIIGSRSILCLTVQMCRRSHATKALMKFICSIHIKR